MHVAIVVPTLDEETNLARRLPHLRTLTDLVVIADGGSTDGTLTVAREHGCRTCTAPRGRGPQLNAGAQRAIGEGAQILLFLHADTDFPDGGIEAIREAVLAGAIGGGFLVRLDAPHGLLRLLPTLVNWRTRRLRVPLGDQGQFVTRDAFERLGGFHDWPILEDFDFVRRLRRSGTMAIIEQPVTPSTRRFEREGVLRAVARNWLLWALFLAGASPHRLARLYRPLS